ncbi:hypothetical protein BC937DRAFT_92965 [Endogone sp. FLAS-F59071]|nr:hypothetical protein BC937DRAFT_92965 [Endogone sp. FLAS-F59071]|eukprot:RUS15049.1 hypothetical protein BC937DRAFT_92965 [Endogone sp. FLAS-F59071]
MDLLGHLYTYNSRTRATAFESGDNRSGKTLVFIGGLTDGYNAVPYLPALNKALERAGWSLVQVTLSSSYLGYGIGSLQQDCEELDELVKFLFKEKEKKKVVFLGHSTGCQDCIWFSRHAQYRERVTGYILQGPVSDREFMAESLDGFEKYLRLATKMRKAGKGMELMPREVDTAPMTADRFYALAAVGGDDDFFSSDLPDSTLNTFFSGISTPIAVIYSAADEYIPAWLNKNELLCRLQTACPTITTTAIIPDADHALSSEEAQHAFIEFVNKFLESVVSEKVGKKAT